MTRIDTRVYVPVRRDDYELCQPIDAADFERIASQVNGAPLAARWKPVAVEIVREDEGRDLLESDSPWLGSHALIFRARAITALGDVLRGHAEILPLTCVAGDLWMCNPISLPEALDEDACSVRRFSDGRIMMIQRYAFRDAAIQVAPIFKIPNLRVSPCFVTDHFVTRWRAVGLRGLDFTEIWGPRKERSARDQID